MTASAELKAMKCMATKAVIILAMLMMSKGYYYLCQVGYVFARACND